MCSGVSLSSWGEGVSLALTGHRRPASHPIISNGLVITKSDFIVRPVETSLGRWTLVVIVINVDDLLFWLRQIWPVTLRIQGSCSLVALCRLIVRRPKLGSSDQETSPSAGKNTRIVLVQCRAWKCVPNAISCGVDISEVLGCLLLRQMISQWRSKIASSIGVS